MEYFTGGGREIFMWMRHFEEEKGGTFLFPLCRGFPESKDVQVKVQVVKCASAKWETRSGRCGVIFHCRRTDAHWREKKAWHCMHRIPDGFKKKIFIPPFCFPHLWCDSWRRRRNNGCIKREMLLPLCGLLCCFFLLLLLSPPLPTPLGSKTKDGESTDEPQGTMEPNTHNIASMGWVKTMKLLILRINAKRAITLKAIWKTNTIKLVFFYLRQRGFLMHFLGGGRKMFVQGRRTKFGHFFSCLKQKTGWDFFPFLPVSSYASFHLEASSSHLNPKKKYERQFKVFVRLLVFLGDGGRAVAWKKSAHHPSFVGFFLRGGERESEIFFISFPVSVSTSNLFAGTRREREKAPFGEEKYEICPKVHLRGGQIAQRQQSKYGNFLCAFLCHKICWYFYNIRREKKTASISDLFSLRASRGLEIDSCCSFFFFFWCCAQDAFLVSSPPKKGFFFLTLMHLRIAKRGKKKREEEKQALNINSATLAKILCSLFVMKKL